MIVLNQNNDYQEIGFARSVRKLSRSQSLYRYIRFQNDFFKIKAP